MVSLSTKFFVLFLILLYNVVFIICYFIYYIPNNNRYIEKNCSNGIINNLLECSSIHIEPFNNKDIKICTLDIIENNIYLYHINYKPILIYFGSLGLLINCIGILYIFNNYRFFSIK